jgi:pimeloyl-ACP methyl ester carboxylesterase
MMPLVLLPGMMCDARLFWPQIAALSQRWTLHLPPISGAHGMAELAARILAHAPPPFALTGLSMGGIVAINILSQPLDLVLPIALMDTNPLAEPTDAQARRIPWIARVLEGGLDAVMRDKMKPLYLADTPRRAEIPDLCMDMARSPGTQAFARQSRALARRPDRTATMSAFKGPALILMGEHDIPCPRDRHDLVHALMP